MMDLAALDQHPAFMYAMVVAFGLVIGSFLNVCIWRIPRDQSIMHPPSACPKCGARIRPWQNVPVLGWIMLRGKCAACREPISARYPVVEALNGALYASVLWRYGWGWHLVPLCAFVSALVVITYIDLDFQIIPDRITVGGTPIALLAGAFLLPDAFDRMAALGWAASLIGAASGFGLFFMIAWLSRGGMGGGDIKMMALVGAMLGWKGVFLTTFAGSLAGSVAGVGLMVAKGAGRKAKVPFGPFLALGAYGTLMFGQEAIRWYLG
jgi:leader peptidase (prepilin peptidase)/N-methyltransferase